MGRPNLGYDAKRPQPWLYFNGHQAVNVVGRRIGSSEPAYLIAEAGSNHNGCLHTALNLIAAAAECGADAIKFQYFRAATMVAPEHPDYATFERYEVPEFWLRPLKDHAADCGIHLFYSVFDPEDVAVLERYDVPAYKIASAELTYTPLLEAVAATGKPVILSTGMSTEDDMQHAVNVVADLPSEVVMLHCVSAYPAPPEDMNLRCIKNSQVIWGLSDHTAEPFAAPLMAAALGACIIEKHFTMDRSQEGPDHAFAIEPPELKALAMALHSAHLMLGDGCKRVQPSERAALCDRRTLQNGKWLRGMPNDHVA